MQLDYQIHHIYNNYMVEGRAMYDYVQSEIWVHTQTLCHVLGEKLGIYIEPDKSFITTYELALEAWKILEKFPGIDGIYGDKFLNEW